MRVQRRALTYGWLLIGSVVAPACRFGYQELDSASGSGASSSQGGSTAAGTSATGGSSQTAAGEGPGSGAGQNATGTSAGQPGTLGGAPALGDGGAASPAGTTGAAGSPGEPPACTATTACSCASLQGHSYWFCKNLVNRAAAEAQCETQAMHLVRIDSQAEVDFLTQEGTLRMVFNNDGFASIGASDQAVAGEWRWVDGTLFWQGGSSGAAVGGLYSNWSTASPSASGAKQCAGILSLGSWQDRSCTALESFICEGP